MTLHSPGEFSALSGTNNIIHPVNQTNNRLSHELVKEWTFMKKHKKRYQKIKSILPQKK